MQTSKMNKMPPQTGLEVEVKLVDGLPGGLAFVVDPAELIHGPGGLAPPLVNRQSLPVLPHKKHLLQPCRRGGEGRKKKRELGVADKFWEGLTFLP